MEYSIVAPGISGLADTALWQRRLGRSLGHQLSPETCKGKGVPHAQTDPSARDFRHSPCHGIILQQVAKRVPVPATPGGKITAPAASEGQEEAPGLRIAIHPQTPAWNFARVCCGILTRFGKRNGIACTGPLPRWVTRAKRWTERWIQITHHIYDADNKHLSGK